MKYQFSTKKKQLALLIDPDKISEHDIILLVQQAETKKIDLLLVGGSLLHSDIEACISCIKSHCSLPVYLFPGSSSQVVPNADGILFLSLISGRNAEFLIGNHVIAAPLLKKSKLDIYPVGYVLIDGGKPTAVEYISNTRPIPYEKNDIAVATALAGEMLGLKAIYLEAGSGAASAISPSMIKAVKSALTIPLIVGGGIRTVDLLMKAFESGADIAVIGTAVELNQSLLSEFAEVTKSFNA